MDSPVFSIPVHVETLQSSRGREAAMPVATKQSRGFHFDMHGVLLGFAIALMALAGGVSFMNKKIVQELQVKDMQISALIDEVGEVRAENQHLYEQLVNQDQSMTLVQESVIALENRVEAVDGSGGLFGLQSKLDDANKELEAQAAAMESLMEAGLELSDGDAIPAGETLDVLVLGTNGSLTDTILLASVNPQKKTVSLFSIPRDLAVDGRRINEYYWRYGIDPMREKIETITGLYPEKYVVFDLASFEDVIDLLGGIDVTLEKAIYDTMYPGPNYTYTTFSLSAGEHHLDGKTALMFARSRKSTTDFDRASRQQQVVEAVRNKFEELNLLENTDELVEMYSTVIDSLDTDIDLLSMIGYATQYHDYTIERGNVLSTTNYLYSTTGMNGAYLVLPRDATYQTIKNFVAEIVRE